jgi:DNA-binding LacI/PurR family transcriptional regulator
MYGEGMVDTEAELDRSTPPLTSVEQLFEAIGRRAVEVLLDDIEGRLDGPVHIDIPAELIIRGSSVKRMPE